MGKEATQFKKGQSGNPRGRAKTEPLTTQLHKLLAEPSDGSANSNAHMVAWAVIQRAKAGDMVAARLLWEYVEGKPTQRVQFDIAKAARKLAAEMGLDPGELLAEAERIVAAAALVQD